MRQSLEDILYVPFEKFYALVQFKQDEATKHWTATVGDYFLGQCDDLHDVPLKAWKNDVFRNLARFSKTIELRTACGCKRLMEGYDRRERGIIVPIKKDDPLVSLTAAVPDEAFNATYQKREFKYRGQLSDDGFRLFEEVLN